MVPVTPTHLSEASRFLRRRLFYREQRRFSGSGERICKQIVASCWNGKYLQVSNGNHCQFYSRDIGWCAKSLMLLGFGKQLKKTLAFAIEKMRGAGRITVALTPSGMPFDFPNAPSIDSAAYLLYALKIAKAKKLIDSNAEFLEKSVMHLCKNAVGPDGLPKQILLSGMRDHAVRQASCYDTAALGFLSKNLGELGLHNPLEKIDYAKILRKRYWTGKYFLDDLSGKKTITADANLCPFFWKVINDGEMMKNAMSSVRKEGLDSPLLVRYVAHHDPADKMLWTERLVRGWEKNSYWPQLDAVYLSLLHKISPDAADEKRNQSLQLIEKHGTLFEVYTSEGLPFKTPFYVADEGMLWAGNYARKGATYQ